MDSSQLSEMSMASGDTRSQPEVTLDSLDESIGHAQNTDKCPHCLKEFTTPYEGFMVAHIGLCQAEERDILSIMDDGLSPSSKERLNSGDFGLEDQPEGSPDNPYIQSSEDEFYQRPKRVKCLNKQERILEGLTTGLDAPLVVREGGAAGRGVFATGAISKGQWLCEYKAAMTYPPSEKPKRMEEYDLNSEGSYVVETSYSIPGVGKLCWDATRRFHQTGRYLNHAQHPNAELTAPTFARGKWRIGFVAVRDIQVGDEVVWDYKVRGEVWSGCQLVGGTVQKTSDGGSDSEPSEQIQRKKVRDTRTVPVRRKSQTKPSRTRTQYTLRLTGTRRQRIIQIESSEDDESQATGKTEAPPTTAHAKSAKGKGKSRAPPSPPLVKDKGKGKGVALKKVKPKPRRDTRKRHFCPICGKAEKKLTQHMQDQHPEISTPERLELSRKSVIAPRKGAVMPLQREKQQPSVKLFFAQTAGPSEQTKEDEGEGSVGASSEEKGEGLGLGPSSEEDSEGSESEARVLEDDEREDSVEEREERQEAEESCVGSREPFPQDHPFLVQLRDYLTSRHGKGRSKSEAAQISAEVSRYLFSAQPASLDQHLLLNAEAMNAYLTSIERAGLTPSTERAKLNRLRSAIDFVSLEVRAKDMPLVEKIRGILKNWISVLGKEARRRNRISLEEASENPAGLDVVDRFVNLPDLRRLIERLAVKAERKEVVACTDLRSSEVWLAGCLLLSNHQRPGAIANATVAEWAASKATVVGRKEYKTFYVTNHKTATTGRAKITVSKEIGRLLDLYVRLLRPLLAESTLLFPNKDGSPIDHLSRHMAILGKKHGIDVPNATQSRRAAATAVSTAGSEADREAVATMMSHSVQTQQRYYAMTKGRDKAVTGYRVMESLRHDAPGGAATTSGRVTFSDSECESISLYFREYVEAESTPPISVCHEFLRDHPINRDAKQIRDKVRTLIKQHKQ